MQLAIRSANHRIADFVLVKITDHPEAFERKLFQRLLGAIQIRLIYSGAATGTQFRLAQLERVGQVCLIVICKGLIWLDLWWRRNLAAHIRSGIFDEITQILKLLASATS